MFAPPYWYIIVSSWLIGLATGWVMHRSDFCITACFRDLFLFRDAFLLRQLVLLVVASMALFEAGRWSGLITLYPFPLLGPPSLTNAVGGLVFGVGMVLAGGCVCGSLYKVGAGSLTSLVALVGMLVGSAVYAEFHPVWSAWAQATQLTPRAVTVPQWLGVAPTWLVLPLAAALAYWLWGEYRAGRMVRRSYAAGHVDPWRAALVLAVLGFVSYVLVGMPMGITTAYAKLAAGVEQWFAPEHVRQVAYYAAVPLNYTPPYADRLITGGPGPQLDGIAAIQYPLLLGSIAGACVSAWCTGDWHLRWRLPGRQWVSAFVGGTLLGLAARMAPSCNIWHLWGGLPILAMQSLLFLLGLLPGTWLGARILARFVIR